MASKMPFRGGYLNNVASNCQFSYRASNEYNSKGPGPLHPHSSLLRSVQTSNNIATTSNYFKINNKTFEANDTPAKSSVGTFKKYQPYNKNNRSANQSVVADESVDDPAKERVRDVTEVRVYCGNVDKLIKWHKLLSSAHIIYVVLGSVIQMRQGTLAPQRIMLLRSCKETGPVLQVVYYMAGDRIEIKDFHIGQNLRCVGRMIGTNMLRAYYIRDSTIEEVHKWPRMQAISDRSVLKLAGKYQ